MFYLDDSVHNRQPKCADFSETCFVQISFQCSFVSVENYLVSCTKKRPEMGGFLNFILKNQHPQGV